MRRVAPLAVASGTALTAVLAGAVPAGAAVPTDTSALRTAVTAAGVFMHLDALQDIADANQGTRASGTSGYTASADYVAKTLGAAGYRITRQPFSFDRFVGTGPASFDRLSPTHRAHTAARLATRENSRPGTPTRPVQG